MTAIASFCTLVMTIWPVNTGDVSSGYVEAIRRDLGEITVTVWQLPAEPVVGAVQFGVELIESSTTQPHQDALVKVYVTPPYEGERLFSPAISTPARTEFYEALLNMNHVGDWEVEIVVAEHGSVNFDLNVGPRLRSGPNTVWASVAFYSVQGLFVLGLVFLIVRTRRRAKRPRS